MHTKRVLKKISTPFEAFDPHGAILMVNMVDPQVNTMKVFLEAIEDVEIPFFAVANKMDLVNDGRLSKVEEELGLSFIPASMLTMQGMGEIRAQFPQTFAPGDRIAVLGVFNSGKTSLIGNLTGLDLAIGNLPGTTLELLCLRLRAEGTTEKIEMPEMPYMGEDAYSAVKAQRRICHNGEFLSVPIYDGNRVGNGHRISGPAIVEEPNTTIFLTADYELFCDRYNNYLMYPLGKSLEETL